MCNTRCIIFGAKCLAKEEIKGKKVIEVGSCDVNGSLRPFIESWLPAKYVGIDLQKGPGVDVVCSAEKMVRVFGKESFGVVISTELLEHVRDWRKVISNIKNICQPGGVILLTTRSYGYAYHGYPYDFWRYEVRDMNNIFSDCQILALEKDPQRGVFIKVKKPKKFTEKNLSGYKLYSIVADRRVAEITGKDFQTFYFFCLALKAKVKKFIAKRVAFLLQP